MLLPILLTTSQLDLQHLGPVSTPAAQEVSIDELVPRPKKPYPPDYKSIKNTNDARQEKLREAARVEAVVSSCNAVGGTLDGETCILPPPPPPPVVEAPVAYTAPAPVYVDLVGSYGYALADGNCVNEPGVNNPGWGNPIEWGVTSSTPWIGASALFWYNHVAVVTGLWSNGDVEVRQQNCPGCATRYNRAEIRGYR